MLTVYYDGKCGLCRREIEHYQRLVTQRSIAGFDWVDVASSPARAAEINVSHVEALRALHVQTSTGDVVSGADAFIVIWKQLPGVWSVLGRFTALPGIYFLASHIYHVFAAWRFSRLEHCQLALKTERQQQVT